MKNPSPDQMIAKKPHTRLASVRDLMIAKDDLIRQDINHRDGKF
jgi:hypothetical protein